MFAGRYEEAITALNKAMEIDPNYDYLYGTMAKSYLLKGLLAKAIETLKKEMNITQEESVKHDASFFLGYAEFLRGNIEKSSQELNSVRKFYSEEPFVDSVDESPNLSFWLTGIIYFKKGDLMKLNEIIRNFEQKISTKGVSATNYFRIYKFYNHLIILKAFLQNDKDLIRAKIEEGRKIKDKMGYWDSMFNLSFFFNEYAKILIEINREKEALELLNEAIEYNPNYPASYINLAEIHLNNNDLERAQEASQKAQVLLNDSDKDFILVTELEDINRRILMPNDLEK